MAKTFLFTGDLSVWVALNLVFLEALEGSFKEFLVNIATQTRNRSSLGLEEFLNLMAKLVGRDPYEELNDALKVFDRTGDGFILVKAWAFWDVFGV